MPDIGQIENGHTSSDLNDYWIQINIEREKKQKAL